MLLFFSLFTFRYDYYERVENGDLIEVVPGKFIAFSGPTKVRTNTNGYTTLTPGLPYICLVLIKQLTIPLFLKR